MPRSEEGKKALDEMLYGGTATSSAQRRTGRRSDEAKSALDELLYGDQQGGRPEGAMGPQVSTVTGNPVESGFPKRGGEYVEIGGKIYPGESIREVGRPNPMNPPTVSSRMSNPFLRVDPSAFAATQMYRNEQDIQERSPNEVAGFGTEAAVSWSDNPMTQLRMYASKRFPDLPIDEAVKRYGLTRDGEFVFLGDDGNVYRESGGGLRRFAASNLAGGDALANVGGAVAGPVGAMAGRAAQRGVQSMLDRQDDKEQAQVVIGGVEVPGLSQQGLNNLLAVLGEGAAEKLGELAGLFSKGGAETVQASLKRPIGAFDKKGTATARSLKYGGDDFTGAFQPGGEAERLEGVAREYMGGGLNVPVSTGRRSAAEVFRTGLSDPRTADEAQSELARMSGMAQKGVDRMSRDIAPNQATVEAAGRQISEAGRRSIDQARENVTREARKAYSQAYENAAGGVDVAPIVESLDEIKGRGYSTGKVNRLASRIQKDIQSDGGNDVQKLHGLRKEIDSAINSGSTFEYGRTKIDATSDSKETMRALKSIRRAIDEQLKAVPGFREADHAYRAAREKYVEPFIGSIVEKSSRLTGDRESIRALNTLFRADKELTAEAVSRARRQIEDVDPDAWRNAVAAWMNQQVKSSISAEEASGNIPRKIVNALWKNENQAEIMRAALPKENQRIFEDMMTIMDRMGRLYNEGSPTGARNEWYLDQGVEAMKTATGRAVRGASKMAKFVGILSPKKVADMAPQMENTYRRYLMRRHLEDVMSGLINPSRRVKRQIEKVRAMRHTNPEYWERVGALFGQAAWHWKKQQNQMDSR